MPGPPDDALRSPDGNSWWDGAAWQPIEASALPPPPPPPPPPVPAQELRDIAWVYGTFDVTADGVAVHQRNVGAFGKARDTVYPFADIATAEVYGSILTLRLRNGEVRGIQHIAQPEAASAALQGFGVDASTVRIEAPPSAQLPRTTGSPHMAESEKYFRRKNAAQRKRKIGRALGTTACCGLPCLISLTLMLGVLATLLLALMHL
jgi:hypothetical protein